VSLASTHRGAILSALFLVFAFLPAGGSNAASLPEAVSPSGGAGTQGVDRNTFLLGRAVAELAEGNLRAARALLRECDLRSPASFSGAERAAFLLAETCLRLGDRNGFLEVTARASGWGTGSVYSRWITFLGLAVRGEDPALPVPLPVPAAEDPNAILSAVVLLEAGAPEAARQCLGTVSAPGEAEPLRLYLDGLAALRLGDPAPESWERLLTSAPESAGDLVGAASLQLAVQAMEAKQDPTPYLSRIPTGSRFAAAGFQIRALLADEAGDPGTARQWLTRMLEGSPGTGNRSEALLRLGALALDAKESDEALARYREAEAEWLAKRAMLERLREDGGTDVVWSSWTGRIAGGGTLDLDLAPAWESAQVLVERSLDLSQVPESPVPPASPGWIVASGSDSLAFLPLPPAAERARVDRLRLELDDARAALEGVRWEREQEAQRLDRRTRYLEAGHTEAEGEKEALAPGDARLEDLLSRTQEIEARLESLRNLATTRFRRRAAELRERCEADLVWLEALDRFFVSAPDSGPSADGNSAASTRAELLERERELAETLKGFLESFEENLPERLDPSLAAKWTAELEGEARRLEPRAKRQSSRLGQIAAALDSSQVTGRTSGELRRLDLREIVLTARADSLETAHAEARRDLAQRGIEEAITRLDTGREAIDYGLAAASYQIVTRDLALLGGEPVSAPSLDLLRRDREEARARLSAFLDRHPGSFARGETRFRLADVLLLEAKDDFDRKMEQFLGEGKLGEEAGKGRVPFVDYAGAIDLYRAMLAEDREFLHLDAVLFNLGMILSDQSDPGAAPLLTELVEEHPESPFCQEAYLRLGDDAFDRSHYADSVPLYEKAAQGPDAGLRAIALYRIGWAEFSEDRFLAAADAFRRLLDLYGSGEEIVLKNDLRAEGKEYLVHSLARAGGAPAFASYFDDLGPRPYEEETLLGVAALLEEFSLYAQSAEADALFLHRYPLSPGALAGAERLVETYERSNRPAEAREARLEAASTFAPGGAWNEANRGDTLLVTAEAFAQDCYKQVALYHHHRARDGKGGDEDWRAALDLYDVMLATWPRDPGADTLHAYAGEAAGHLHDYPTALAHYEAAATAGEHAAGSSGSSRFRQEVEWQRVSLTDAWYRSTRSQTGDGAPGLGADSLATALRAAVRGFLQRYPDDPRTPDAVWRMGNVTFAHGRDEEAAEDMEEFVRRYPEDARAPRAEALRGDAFYRAGFFDRAGDAYGTAQGLARGAGQDSLVAALEPLLPHCAYRHAEAVEARGNGAAEAASLFEGVAERWPGDELAPQALYRAGLDYRKAGDPGRAVAAWTRYLDTYPDHDYGRDAYLQIASTWEAADRTADAARAYERVSLAFPEDEGAPDALLKATELLAASGDSVGAEDLQLSYVERFPEDVETGMAILAPLATRELDALDPGRPVSSLTRRAADGKPATRLAAYLSLAGDHKELADPELLARVRFLEGEELLPAYQALALRQPLEASIEAKKAVLEDVIATYGKCAEYGVTEWTRAAAYRIGEALVSFGTALEESERPGGVEGDDLLAYEDVLYEQAWGFQEKGEAAWADLLRRTREESGDPGGWIARTQRSLWPRLAQRFLFMPEVEFPLVAGTAPAPAPTGEGTPAGVGETPVAGTEGGAATPAQE